MNTNTQTAEQLATADVLLAKDYVINYYGNELEIKNTKKVLAHFVYGSGGSDDSGYYGGASYDLYIPNEKDFGSTLIKIGNASDYYYGYEVSCKFTINDKTVEMEGFTIDNLFNRIFSK